MLNNCTFIGRLVRDPEMKTVGEATVANFTIAVDKRFKSKAEGAPTADFIPVCAWRNTADFVNKYFHKGKQVSVVGALETYSYEKDGERRYGFQIRADQVGFADSKKDGENGKEPEHPNTIPSGGTEFDGFGPIPMVADDDLPF